MLSHLLDLQIDTPSGEIVRCLCSYQEGRLPQKVGTNNKKKKKKEKKYQKKTKNTKK